MTEQELIESFAGNLDYIMRSEHMNQSELARRSHLSRESICKYIKGQRMPTLKALMNLSYALRCNIEELTPFIQLID